MRMPQPWAGLLALARYRYGAARPRLRHSSSQKTCLFQ